MQLSARSRPHILLTGRPGVGKSTVIAKVLQKLPNVPVCGFYTRELRGPAGRVGFEAITLDGRRCILAHVNEPGPYRVGKYSVAVARFETEIVPSIDPAHVEYQGIIIMDEIGKMECLSSRFQAAVMRALDSTATVLGTIGLQNDAFSRAIRQRPDVRLIEVRHDNRDHLADIVIEILCCGGE